MRKTFAVLLALSLALVGAEAALASVPHVHGSDFDHSRHGACPVHLAGLHGVDQLHAAAGDFAVAEAFSYFTSHEAAPAPVCAERVPASSRAPPASA